MNGSAKTHLNSSDEVFRKRDFIKSGSRGKIPAAIRTSLEAEILLNKNFKLTSGSIGKT